MTRLATPALRTFQSLWAMEDLPTAAAPWTLEEQIGLLVQAGYAGVAVDLGARRAPTAEALALALAGSGLERMVFTFAGTTAALDEALDYAARIEARDMVLCASVYPDEPREAADLVAGWHARAAAAGVHLELETHRNTLTNDLRFTRRLVDELDPAVRLAIDLSHYIVGAEIPAEPTAEIEEKIAAILSRAGSLQGRIASRCQVQIPLHHEGSQPWIALTRRWWRDGFAHLLAAREGAAREEPVTFVTELGTTPYALVDADGVELSDRWAEARQLIEWAEADLAAAARTVPLPA
ncbi:TIM barrel protein [Microbacterium sp. TNHR37B]|uniref:TIM barrel protein n=1 Tax=Microbacterium sp. TNHR37B TaxID=1775956 RepID=UPI0007B2FBB0|nr:TIM barrel protein [Microbacterium sp. TNHR37B]KZE89864.1 hypothetical protein AVP41_02666 [Microbacterium sp. TNHR37B]